MSEKLPQPSENQLLPADKDIAPVLLNWEFEPGTVSVRKVRGLDGLPKLQMRLDLGLLQMEVSGRPDGKRPHGHESLLDYHEARLKEHAERNGTDLGFALSSEQCQQLREEALMYYHRYLSLFVLEDFRAVMRDTARNMRVYDLCRKYATEEADRVLLEQYRPYITMMHHRAEATMLMREERYADALKVVKGGLSTIRGFFREFRQPDAYYRANEVRILKRLGKEIRKKLPVDPVADLKKQLQKAVQREDYEKAARLRDRLKHLAPDAE